MSIQRWRTSETLPWRRHVIELHGDCDPYAGTVTVLFNGEPVINRHTSRRRDGGTTIITFKDQKGEPHRFVMHRRLNSEHYESLDGDRLVSA